MQIQFSLLISALFSLANAVIYFFVGRTLSRRRVRGSESALAWRTFVIWWYALGVSTIITFGFNTMGALGIKSLNFMVSMTYVNLLVICIALWGLLYYLFYLFSGNTRWFTILTIFYIFYYQFLVFYITVSTPEDVTINRWSVELAYRFPLTGGLFLTVLILLVTPQILGALAYFTLYFKVRERSQRYRIVLVSWSIIIWFSLSFFASSSGWSSQDWWQIISRFVSLTAAVFIFVAYQPPAWVTRRFDIHPITSSEDE